jgi:hypothetical protein
MLPSPISSNFTGNITDATKIYQIPRVDALPRVNLSADSIPDVKPNWELYKKSRQYRSRPNNAAHGGYGDYALCCVHEVENLNFAMDCKLML